MKEKIQPDRIIGQSSGEAIAPLNRVKNGLM
jgi:hypothetical protein